MEKVFYDQETVGELQWEPRGKNVQATVSCDVKTDAFLRCWAQTERGWFLIGLLAPKNGKLTLSRTLSAETLKQMGAAESRPARFVLSETKPQDDTTVSALTVKAPQQDAATHTATKSAESKTANTETAKTQTANSKSANTETTTSKTAENKAANTETTTSKTANSKAVNTKTAEPAAKSTQEPATAQEKARAQTAQQAQVQTHLEDVKQALEKTLEKTAQELKAKVLEFPKAEKAKTETVTPPVQTPKVQDADTSAQTTQTPKVQQNTTTRASEVRTPTADTAQTSRAKQTATAEKPITKAVQNKQTQANQCKRPIEFYPGQTGAKPSAAQAKTEAPKTEGGIKTGCKTGIASLDALLGQADCGITYAETDTGITLTCPFHAQKPFALAHLFAKCAVQDGQATLELPKPRL